MILFKLFNLSILSFLVCKMRIIIVSTSRGHYGCLNEINKAVKCLLWYLAHISAINDSCYRKQTICFSVFVFVVDVAGLVFVGFCFVLQLSCHLRSRCYCYSLERQYKLGK